MILDLLYVIFPLSWIAMLISWIIAVNYLSYIYNEPDKAGFDMKIRTWGPSYIETKRILLSTKDVRTRARAKKSLKMWKVGFYCGIISGISYLAIIILPT